MTRVKICGLRDPHAAAAACEAGVDAIGLVFYAPSPRAVDITAAREVIGAVQPLVTVVGLFVDPRRDEVERVLEHCPLDCLQFHGQESEAFCASFARPYLRAVSMRPQVVVETEVERYPSARAFLLDAWREDAPGGTGETFAWERIPAMRRPWILAGGLTPANVGRAIAEAQPPAIDVSGGVEKTRGVKSPHLIFEFMDAVRRADRGEEG
jgi:phosphoribosylanthranilate isomerase